MGSVKLRVVCRTKLLCWYGTKILWDKKEYCHLQSIYILIKLGTVGLNFGISIIYFWCKCEFAVSIIYNVLARTYSVLSDIIAIS